MTVPVCTGCGGPLHARPVLMTCHTDGCPGNLTDRIPPPPERPAPLPDPAVVSRGGFGRQGLVLVWALMFIVLMIVSAVAVHR